MRRWSLPAALSVWLAFLFAVEGGILPRALVAAFFLGCWGAVYALSRRPWFSLAFVTFVFAAV